MIVNRAFKVELDPNNKQRTALLRHAGTARWAYNWGLAGRIAKYKETGEYCTAIDQHKELVVLKKTPPYSWLYKVSKCAAQEALRDLDKAYQNFFYRIKAQVKEKGFPKFKSRKKGIGSFRLNGNIHISIDSVKLPVIGTIRLKEHGYIPTEGIKILSATCSERAGRWFVSVCCEIETIEPEPGTGATIGVDLGIKTMAAISDGRQFENPKALRKSLVKLRRLEREKSRRQKGGRNRDKTRQKIARLHYRIANIRKDALHKATSAIVKVIPKPSTIVLEDLNVAGMVKNHKLAKAVSDVGMGEFARQIQYKAQWYGVKVVFAPRFFPSSKLCHVCGVINDNLTLADREWTCECGAAHDRDLNAAINLALLATKYRQFDGNLNACGQDVRPTLVGDPGGDRNQALVLLYNTE